MSADLVIEDVSGGYGLVQVLHGRGLSEIPSALAQGRWRPAHLQRAAGTWARQLRGAGVNMNLAPVADTVPGFDAASWQMLVAPAKTPRPIVDKLHAELKAILTTPDMKERIVNDGMLTMDNPSVEGLQDFVKAEIVRWGKVAQQAGLAGTQ